MLNAQAGDTITFNPYAFSPGYPTTIWVLSPLSTLTQNNVTIDASNAGVILDGSLAPAGTKGLVIEADNCTIRGLTVQNFKSQGVYVGAGASGNVIGGNRALGNGPNGQGNRVSNNGSTGVEIRGAGAISNSVQGNYIGIDATGWWTGTNAYNGVALTLGAQGNLVGGARKASAMSSAAMVTTASGSATRTHTTTSSSAIISAREQMDWGDAQRVFRGLVPERTITTASAASISAREI